MRLLVLLLTAAAAAPALAASDPVAACKANHADDLEAYARCLEAALRSDSGEQGQPELQAAAAKEDGAKASSPAQAPDARDSRPAEAREAKKPAPTGLGAEQIREERQDEPDEVQVVIVGATYNAAGLGTFRTEDGQVWRETSKSPPRRQLEPEQRYEASIVRGKLGGYRMHVEGIRWMKTVRRVE